MFRFLALAATAALVSAQTCTEREADLEACITAIHVQVFPDETAYEAAVQSCCHFSQQYTANCGEENAYLDWWASQKEIMNPQQWKTALYMLNKCPRDSMPDCVDKVAGVATCVRDTILASDYLPSCCPTEAGRCHGYEISMLWDQIEADPSLDLDRATLEEQVGMVFSQCQVYSEQACGKVVDVLMGEIGILPPDATYERDMTPRCTAGSAVSYICGGQPTYLEGRKAVLTDTERDHFNKQVEACNIGDDEDHDDGSPDCGSIIPDVYLYKEDPIWYLAMEDCPTTGSTGSPGALCQPVHNPATGEIMFYKVGYFNPITMMETPEDCRPLMP